MTCSVVDGNVIAAVGMISAGNGVGAFGVWETFHTHALADVGRAATSLKPIALFPQSGASVVGTAICFVVPMQSWTAFALLPGRIVVNLSIPHALHFLARIRIAVAKVIIATWQISSQKVTARTVDKTALLTPFPVVPDYPPGKPVNAEDPLCRIGKAGQGAVDLATVACLHVIRATTEITNAVYGVKQIVQIVGDGGAHCLAEGCTAHRCGFGHGQPCPHCSVFGFGSARIRGY